MTDKTSGQKCPTCGRSGRDHELAQSRGTDAESGQPRKANSLLIAGGSALDVGDCELLLLALDLLERLIQYDPANTYNNIKQAAMLHMRSRLLTIRAKLQAVAPR